MTTPPLPLSPAPVKTARRANFPGVSLWRRAGWLLLPALLLLAGVQPMALAKPPKVSFPAAAGIKPSLVPVGPVQIAPEPSALSQFARPDDFVIFDSSGQAPANATITVVNGGLSGTFGATTVVASSSVGSGVAFHPASQGCVSPSQQLYYWDSTFLAFVVIDLTQSNFPRALVPIPTNTSLVPGFAATTSLPGMVWDYSTNTILYQDFGSGSARSTIARGIYRLNPITGVNTLYAPLANDGRTNAIAIKQDGSAVYVFNQNANIFGVNAAASLIAPVTGTLTVVDGGPNKYGATSTQPRYYEAGGLSWDIVNQRLNIFDVGDDQTSSRILRLDPASATRTFVSNGSAGPSATNGGTLINAPTVGFTNTAGRIIYTEEPADISSVFPATIASGSAAVTRVGSSSFSNTATISSYVPPTLPVITSPAATAGANGTTATLGATVTSAGTAIVTPTIQARGVVYSLTSTNSSPVLGGTGVSNLTSPAAVGAFTVSASGLSSGAQYSYAGYVSTLYGTVYTAVGTFTTATLPTVTSPTATNITGVSATLGGNVTSDGGGTLTARGVVYSTSANTTSPVIGASGVTTITDASATTGVFADGTGNNLANGTAYSYRAYATNGVGTAYSATGSFTTAARPVANAQSVSVAFNTAKAITLTGSDPNTPTQTLTYAIVTGPTKGTLTGTAPNLTYMPANGANGTDSFTFTVTNTSNLTSVAATVSITVAAGVPTATAQSGLLVNLNLPRTVTLAGTDPDNPALALTYTVTAQPANGTLSGTAPNLTYTPNANYSGADSFTFTVSNGQNTSAAATVSLTVVGQPTISSFTPASGPVGTTVTITGTNLQNATGVSFFRNLIGTNFTVVSSTQVTVKVPTGAGTGILTLISGSGSNSSSTKFTVTP